MPKVIIQHFEDLLTFSDSKALKVSSIVIKNRTSTTLYENMFKRFPNLQEVSFRDCKLPHLPNKIFYPLPKLTHVSFDGNRISFLPTDLFSKNQELEFVDFSSNNIEEIPYDLFKKNPKVTVVKFRDNLILDIQGVPLPENFKEFEFGHQGFATRYTKEGTEILMKHTTFSERM